MKKPLLIRKRSKKRRKYKRNAGNRDQKGDTRMVQKTRR